MTNRGTTGDRPRSRRLVTVLAVMLLVAALTAGHGRGLAETDRPADRAVPATTRQPEPTGRVDCRGANCVALTFDGGPGRYTARLLDILRERNVRATFFLLGRGHIERRPELVWRIHREGHELANHTWTHRRLTELEPAEVRDELSRTQRAIQQITGYRPRLMRPPQGYTDPRVARIAGSLGLAQVLWTVTAKDYATRNTELIMRRVLAGARRNGVILLHDIYSGTVPAVPRIIDRLERRGFTVVSVSELFGPGSLHPGRTYRDAWVVG